MDTVTEPPTPRGGQDREGPVVGRGERVFRTITSGSGLLVVVVIAAIGLFLLVQAVPSLLANNANFFTSPVFDTRDAANLNFGIRDLLVVTLLSSLFALAIAMPIALGIALFLTQYAPKRVARPFAYVIDLLAAVPSISYGLWGIAVLGPASVPLSTWLYDWFGWLPFFAGPVSATGRTMLVAGLVLAVMILPIITAVSREVFLQTPKLHEEAALALGATRWEMIRMAVLPFGRSGVVSGAMLGLGRALGETMAVAIVLSVSGVVTFNVISSTNPSTIAANIALQFPESSGLAVNVLIASGLVLFVITLLVNALARYIVNRRREFSGAN